MPDAKLMSSARLATAFSFLLNGLGQGTFISRIPDLKNQLAISNSVLGVSLFFGAAGVLSALQFAGWICAKFGSGPAVRILNFTLLLTLPFIGLISGLNIGLIWFWFALFANGFFYAAQDVAMNAQGSTLEVKFNKRIMSRLHALWSLGTFLGGAIGGLATQLKIKPLQHFFLISLAILLVSIFINNRYLEGEVDKHALEHRVKTKRPRVFFILGLLGLCAALGEGAAADWGGILIRDTFKAEGFLIALPFVIYSSTMVIGRLSGDALAHKLGAKNLISIAGSLAGFGLTIGLLVGGKFGVLFGWFFLGIGLSVVIPMMFSAAGSIADKEYKERISGGEAIAIVSGVSYFGFMVGPPIMGTVSDLITLRWAMLIPAALSIIFALGARRVLTHHK